MLLCGEVPEGQAAYNVTEMPQLTYVLLLACSCRLFTGDIIIRDSELGEGRCTDPHFSDLDKEGLMPIVTPPGLVGSCFSH